MRSMRIEELLKYLNVKLLAGIALGLTLLGGNSIYAQTTCTSPEAEKWYDSVDDREPDHASNDPQWSTSCGSFADFATSSLGVLTINDNSSSARAVYCLDGWFDQSCDPRKDAVYELSFATISEFGTTTWGDIDLSFICGMRDGLNDFRLGVASDEVGFADYDDVEEEWFWIDSHTINTRNDHLYRVEKDDTDVRLYIDNATSPVITITLANLSDFDDANQASLLVTSTPGESHFEFYGFRYRIGADLQTRTTDCDADLDSDTDVDADDLILLLGKWGTCVSCTEDFNGDGEVGIDDLITLLTTWGTSC